MAPATCVRGLVVNKHDGYTGRFIFKKSYGICLSSSPCPSSIDNGPRHIFDCRNSAGGNLHLDLDFSSGRLTVLIAA
eukprot:6173828-Pleurochrysis_carterae.AAC.1